MLSIAEFEVPNEIKMLYAGIQGLLKISPDRENDEKVVPLIHVYLFSVINI